MPLHGRPVPAAGPQTIPLESKGPEKPFLSQMSGPEKDPPSRGKVGPDIIGPEGRPSEVKIEFPPELIELLRKAKRITVLTGAGLSAESGIPTFRDGAGALWANVSMEEVATSEAFAKDPSKVWRWHAEQFSRFINVKPNAGHLALAEMEKRFPNFTVITQNIDGLHQEAGSKNVIELHGSLLRARCPAEDRVVELWEETGELPPRCPHCAGPLRHDVVWFKEKLSPETLNAAIEATDRSDVFLSIGTSSRINPAAALAHRAVSSKQTILEINPNETLLTPWATFALRGSTGKVLPALLKALDRSSAVHSARESHEDLAARFRPLFPANHRNKIVESALDTDGRQPHFKERLLAAYAQDPDRGSFRHLMTVFAIQDLFYGDAVASSLGNFDAALLQTLIRKAAAVEDSGRRGRAFSAIFQAMESNMNRRTLMDLFEAHGFADELRTTASPTYPPHFLKLHESVLGFLRASYREQDIVPLMNLVHDLTPTDSVKARRLIRILAQAKKSPDYPPALIDEVVEHARFHPFGKLILKRMLQVFIVEDSSGKLRDLIEDGPKNDTMETLRELRLEGLSPEEIARRINGTHHTAYFEDLRIAHKVVSTLSDIDASLSDFSGRAANLNRIRNLTAGLQSSEEPTPSFWFKLMGDDPEMGRSYPLAAKLRDMVEQEQLRLWVVPDDVFEAKANQSPFLKGAEILFFLPEPEEGGPPQIIMRAPPLAIGNFGEKGSFEFREILRRVKGLPHEGTHVLQALGEDESNLHGAPPFDFGSIDRNERLPAEIMAFLEQTRWDVKNTDIEYWTRSMRLGLNLPLYFLHINDRNNFAETNEELMRKAFESP